MWKICVGYQQLLLRPLECASVLSGKHSSGLVVFIISLSQVFQFLFYFRIVNFGILMNEGWLY